MKKETVWVGYSREYPYLPVAVALSGAELARKMGKSIGSIYSTAYHMESGQYKNGCVCRVVIESD